MHILEKSVLKLGVWHWNDTAIFNMNILIHLSSQLLLLCNNFYTKYFVLLFSINIASTFPYDWCVNERKNIGQFYI